MVPKHGNEDVDEAAMNLDIAFYFNSADDCSDLERRSVDSLVIFALPTQLTQIVPENFDFNRLRL